MLKWSISVLIIWCIQSSEAGSRKSYMTLASHGWELDIRIGNPPRWINVFLNVELSELILMDKKCGVRNVGCSHYCDDQLFSPMYCIPLCMPLTPQSQFIYCNSFAADPARYEGNQQSNRSTRLNEKWLRQMRGTRRLVGEFWTDEFSVVLPSPGKKPKPGVYPITAMRLMHWSMGVFGLKPGPNSAVAQLFDYHKVDRRLLTVSYDSNSLLSLRWVHTSMTFRLGALDGSHCADWAFFPTVGDGSWTLKLDSFDLMGVHFEEEIMIRFGFDILFFMIPDALGDKLVASGKVGRTDTSPRSYNYQRLGAQCRPPGPLVFRHGKTEFKFSDKLFNWSGFQWTRCTTTLRSDPLSNDGNMIVLGLRTLVTQCVALDYDRHMIGFGQARDLASLIEYPD